MSIIKRKAGSEDIVKSILEFDAVPTEGSPNLVESGAVAQAIGKLGKPLQWKGPATVAQLNAGITGIQEGWTYTLTDSGTLTAGSVEVEPGDEVAWTEDDEWFKVGSDTAINAVRYIPTKTIYVGDDIFNLDDASYDPAHWSVSDGSISFTTTTATTDEFDTGITIPSGQKYYLEATISNYTRLTDLFYIKVGVNGDKNDIYNGTDHPSRSIIGNGENLIIYSPFSNVSFTVNFKLSPVVVQNTGSRAITINIENVSNGNGNEKIIDANWNVAIGPTDETFSNNVNASRCIAIGYKALRKSTSGWQNIAIGTFAMQDVIRGEKGVSIGSDSTYMLSNAFENVVIGKGSLAGKGSNFNQTANRNVVIGGYAGKITTTTEEDSVYVGHKCAQSGIGSRCVFIGANVPGFSGGGKNRIGIGYNVMNNEDDSTVIGNASTKKTKVYGNLIVEGTDRVLRKIVFNADNTVTWETVS